MPVSSTSFKPGNPGGGRPPDTPEMRAAKEFARSKSLEAIKKLFSLMDSEDDKIKLLATNSFLDRALGKPAQSSDESQQPSATDTIRMLKEFVSELKGNGNAE